MSVLNEKATDEPSQASTSTESVNSDDGKKTVTKRRKLDRRNSWDEDRQFGGSSC